jgi:hypothetical protein
MVFSVLGWMFGWFLVCWDGCLDGFSVFGWLLVCLDGCLDGC